MKKILLLFTLVTLSACGTTSKIRSTEKSPQNNTGKNSQNLSMSLNLEQYNIVIVNDFTDGITSSKDDPKIISEGKRFADTIASEIKKKNIFDKVERNVNSNESALIIEGKITEYEDGNPALRALIGFGAGRSHFDAKVDFKDNKIKELLAEIDVDKKSWALGGLIASSQDAASHMLDASKRIAEELAITKNKATKKN